MVLTNYSALGTPPDEQGRGVSAHAHRRIMRYHWNNPGIVGQDPHDLSLQIRGRSDLSYDITRGLCIVPRDDAYSEGFYEAYIDKVTVGPVPAGDAANPRIDVVWIRVNDLDFNDRDADDTATNRIEVGVSVGTPAANPTEPAIPARAWRLGAMRMPARASTTSSAVKYGNIDYAVPYGGEMGILARIAENIDEKKSVDDKDTPFLTGTFYFPTDRNILLHAYLCVSTPKKTDGMGVAAVQFYVDGKLYTTRKLEYTTSYLTHERTASVQVSAGRHTFGIAMYNQQGVGYLTHYGKKTDADGKPSNYVGRVLVVKDEGVAI